MTDIPPDLICAAEQARMIDPSDLRILSRAQLDGDPAAIVAALREQRPNLFHRSAKDMTPQERATAIREAQTNPRPVARQRVQAEPPAPPKSAMAMLLEDRAQYFRDHERKFPGSTQGMSLPRKSPWRA